MFVLWGTEFPALFVHTIHRVNVLFSCKAFVLLFKAYKREQRGSCGPKLTWEVETQHHCPLSLQSTLPSGWSTAGVADSNLTQVFTFKVLKC
jgi:hypothetical protein